MNAIHSARPKSTPAADAVIASAQRTVTTAIEGLEAIAALFDEGFSQLVERIVTMDGRLIVTGMGKSGHIARKIAATFASTGTPAYFVHPAEASHGDMGMIATGDIVLALSNSGETAELSELVDYTRRFGITLVGLVRRKQSMLVEVADVAIVLPEVPEASITGAPTTSTTMMLAYGDALAMAVLTRRGFTPEDFRNLHPGGKLGRSLLHVRDLMHGAEILPLVALETPMPDVLLEMTKRALGCAIVTRPDGMLEGIITDGDLRRHMKADMLERRAADVMTRNPLTTTPRTLASEVLYTMNTRSITGLVVVDEGKPAGFIHIHDCLRAGVA